MKQDIKTFVDQIFSINPTVSTVYGSALTVGSRDMAGGGINNSASTVVFKLREETANLAESISNDSNDKNVKLKAQNIEGYLMALQTLGQISEQLCDKLLSELSNIIKE